QQFGGGFRQAGILAAGALHALEHHRDDLVKDIKHARQFAAELEDLDGLEVDLDRVQSNIVRFSVQIMSAGDFVHRCHEQGVHMLPSGPHGIRAVLHR
ncbi:MAG TPA: low specificity L-threonine aldolase, partial [Gemmatimonadetes bacterium]|nr:low specificity L-threonine aldolase [Gemmatimonadota bacterium]